MPLTIRRINYYVKKFYSRIRLIFLVLLIYSLYFFWSSDTGEIYFANYTEKFVDFSGSVGLSVEKINIMGNRNVSNEQILEVLGLNIGDPLLSVSLENSKKTLESVGWIKNAKLERQLPSTINIIIEEKRPFAIWQNRGSVSLIDNEGNKISTNNMSAYKNLVIVVGEDANFHVKNLFTILSRSEEVFKKISAIIRIGGRRWNIRLNNGIEIKLPEDGIKQAWDRLMDVNKSDNLLERDIKLVDLRLPDKLFIEPLNKKN